MDVELTEAIIGLIVAAAILGEALILKVLLPYLAAKTTREQRQLAYGIVAAGVGYAEKSGAVDQLLGFEKLKRAEEWIKRRFDRLGIEYDSDEVRGWIEDVLNDMELGILPEFERIEEIDIETVVDAEDDQ